jgi:hypothetical protein
MSLGQHTEERGVKPALRAQGRLKPDVKVGLFLLACSAIAYAGTFTFESIPDGLIQGLGAAAFPRLVIIVIALLAAFLIWQARKEEPEEIEAVHPMSVVTVGIQLVFMALVPVVGMIVAMFVAVVGMGRIWGAPRWAPLVAVAAGTVGLVYALFVKVFHIPIPLGILDTLLG